MTTNTTPDNIIDGAITEIKKPDNALVIMDPLKFATELFQPYHDQLATAKRKAARVKYDVSTKDGMAEAKELRATFVTIRTTADKAKTEAKRPIDQSGKLILEHYRKLEEAAKAEEAKHDKAIKDEEARIEAEKQRKLAEERARIEAIEGRIAHIRGIPAKFNDAESEVVQAMLDKMLQTQLEPAKYNEHLEEALTEWNMAIDALRELHTKALAREAEAKRIAEERAELARLKAEQEAREKAEKEAAAERDRLARAEADRIEAERRAAAAEKAELERQLAAMRAQLAAFEAPAAAPAVDLAAPGTDATVTAEIEQDHTGIIVGHVQVSSDAPADAQLGIVDEPVPYVAPTVLREPMRVDPAPTAPADDEIIELVANTYGESLKTALDWIAGINFARAYDKLAEKA